MTSADLLALLVEATVATSAAIVLVLVVRRALRRRFGAGAGYGLWMLVPTAFLGILLPAATLAPDPVPTVRLMDVVDAQELAVAAAQPIDIAPWLCALWLLGVVALACQFATQQREFRRALGTLQPCGEGQVRATAVAGLPAAIGFRRPMIVLPADFESRYTPEQRGLMQAHERTHIERGDLHLNALVAGFRCLFWFNPLVQLAARCFRHDQELACDQRVIARHPHARRAYGDAMFHTQLAAQPLPLGCHWGPTHPLKERIAMLKEPMPSRARWLGGSAIVISLALFAGVGAWAGQPKAIAATGDVPAGKIKVHLSARVDDSEAKPPLVMVKNPGELFSFEIEENGHRWVLTGSTRMLESGQLQFNSVVTKDGATFAEPSIVVADGEPASFAIGKKEDDGSFEGLQVDVVLEGMAGTIADAQANRFVPVDAVRAGGPAPDDQSRRANPPRFPPAALVQGVSGKVVLLVDIDAQGNPTAIEVERAEPAGVFDQAAMDAAWNWQFSPAIENGKPVPSQVRVPVHFEADGSPPEEEGNGGAGVMGWATPNTSDSSNRVVEMTCGAVRADVDGEKIACGNLLSDR